MIKVKRNNEILKKSKTMSNSALAKEYHLSRERVKQIKKNNLQYCKKHKKYYYSNCFQCTQTKLFENFKENRYHIYKQRIVEAKRTNYFRPDLLLALLYDEKLKITHVAKILGKSRASIYHYLKNKQHE